MAEPELEELQDEGNLDAIHEMARALSKAIGAKRLYMKNNPIYQRAIAALQATFPPIWDERGELVLHITETEIIYEQTPIYGEKNKSEGISWLLFKDGIRTVTLYPGVEDEELVRFLGVINAARALPSDAEDDMITLLWEEDFECLNYDFVEIGLSDVPPISMDTVGGITDAGGAGGARSTGSGGEEEGAGDGGEKVEEHEVKETGIEFDSRPYFLERKEIDYLKSEIEREYSQDLARNVMSILFDILELEARGEQQEELIDIIDRFVPFFLAERDFRLVTYMLGEMREMAESSESLNDEQRGRLHTITVRLSEKDSIEQIIHAVEEASPPALPDELDQLISNLAPAAVGPIMHLLSDIKSERLRDRLEAAVPALAKAAPEELAKALSSEDKVVIHKVVTLLAELKVSSAVPQLAGFLNDENAGVRSAVVEALGQIGTPGALHELVQAVDDPDSHVRVAAVKVFAGSQHLGGFDKISRAINGKELRKADLAEKTAFFEAYGALAGPKGVPILDPMLNGSGLMKKKPDPEWRACAAVALGVIGTADARASLQKSEKDKDPVVRNAVKKALDLHAEGDSWR